MVKKKNQKGHVATADPSPGVANAGSGRNAEVSRELKKSKADDKKRQPSFFGRQGRGGKREESSDRGGKRQALYHSTSWRRQETNEPSKTGDAVQTHSRSPSDQGSVESQSGSSERQGNTGGRVPQLRSNSQKPRKLKSVQDAQKKDHPGVRKALSQENLRASTPPESPVTIALAPGQVFLNGQRVAPGPGRMMQDYTGVKLDLLPTYRGPKKTVPWAKIPQWFQVAYYRDPVDRLTVEIEEFMEYMQRSPEERRARLDVMTRITDEIRQFLAQRDALVGGGTAVKVYGSEATGLGLPLSDIDLMIVAPNLTSSLSNPANFYEAKERKLHFLRELRTILLNSEHITQEAVVREGGIPLLEVEDAWTGIEVDVSFSEAYADATLSQIAEWKDKFGQDLIDLVVVLKHSLAMRKLGLGAATTPYEGGFGSYILLCMTVGYMHLRAADLRNELRQQKKKMGTGHLLLGLLKYWGYEFRFESQSLSLNPPAVLKKRDGLPAYTFELHSPVPGQNINIAAGAFGTKHLQETLKMFYDTLMDEINALTERAKKGDHAPPKKGILALIMAGDYTNFEWRRQRITKTPTHPSASNTPSEEEFE